MTTVFKDGLLLFVQLIKDSSHLVLLLFVMVFMSFYSIFPDLSLLQVQPDIPTLVKLFGFLIASAFIYMYVLLLIGYEFLSDKKQSFFAYFLKKFVVVSVDLVRAYNIIFLFSLFFILPGIYKYLRYVFVPYLALERNQNVSLEEFDSLKKSTVLTKNKKVLFTVFIVYLLFIPFDLITLGLNDRRLGVILILSASMLFVVLYHCILVAYYRRLKSS